MARGKSTSPEVLKYIQEQQGEYVYVDTVCKDLGLERAQVQGAISNLRNRHNQPIEVVQKGTIWRWKPNAENEKSKNYKRVFEEVGATRTGAVVIQDEDGNLYKAVELE